MSLSRRVITSGAWGASATYVSAGISFAGNVILARLLLPEDFGMYALTASLLALLFMISGFGSQEAIVQCRDATLRYLVPTAFWMTIVLGLGLAAIGTMLGLLMAPRYGETVARLIVLLSWLSLAGMIGNAYGAVLKRNLSFRPIAVTQIFATFTSFSVAVLAAYSGWGIWSLLVRQATHTLLELIGFAGASRFRLQRRYNKQAALWIWSFGWRAMGNRIGEVIFESADKLAIGSFLGTAALGQYGIAYRLALVGHQFSYGAVYSVVYSTFATVQYEATKLRMLLERQYFWLYRSMLLFGLVVWFCGYGTVILVYGDQWQTAAMIFRNMAVFLLLLPLETSTRIFLTGAGHIALALRVRLWQLAVYVPAILAAAFWGNLLWVVWTVNVSAILIWVLAMRHTSKIVTVSWGYLLRMPLIAAFNTLICTEALTRTAHLIGLTLGQITMQAAAVCVLYITSLCLLERKSLVNEWAMIRNRLASSQDASRLVKE